MQTPGSLSDLAHSIDLALAPVFLLSGVGAFLNVMANRLARIIDRTRALEEGMVPEPAGRPGAHIEELRALWARRRLMNRAITLCTYCALLVAGVVAMIFIGAVTDLELTIAVSIGFIAAMAALIGGLLSFLREVHIGLRYVRGLPPPPPPVP